MRRGKVTLDLELFSAGHPISAPDPQGTGAGGRVLRVLPTAPRGLRG